jgi:hypothetical protein
VNSSLSIMVKRAIAMHWGSKHGGERQARTVHTHLCCGGEWLSSQRPRSRSSAHSHGSRDGASVPRSRLARRRRAGVWDGSAGARARLELGRCCASQVICPSKPQRADGDSDGEGETRRWDERAAGAHALAMEPWSSGAVDDCNGRRYATPVVACGREVRRRRRRRLKRSRGK